MDMKEAFASLQREVNANPEIVEEARRRRDLFREAFDAEDDVVACLPSGSLARGSQIEPINDVDMIIVFDAETHEGWGTPGQSAKEALDEVQSRVRSLLGSSEGSVAQEVRLARSRTHAVKCWLDDPDDESSFTVDVTPALRVDGSTLLIPEKRSEKWIRTAPELLIDRVAARHAEWRSFVPLVRTLKRWNRDAGATMKSLLVEVLALDHLPIGEAPDAVARFFTASGVAIASPVEDPAGLCGEIQPELDRGRARARLEAAAETSWRAVKAAEEGDTDEAACQWREVFGDIFPSPPRGCGGSTGAGKGAAAVAAVRPRPVRDAPQG